MNKRIETVRIINNIMVAYLLSSMLMIFLQLPVGGAVFAWNLTLGAFLLMSEIIQASAGNLILYLLFHFVAGGLCLYLPYLYESRAFAGVTFGGVFLYSLLTTIRLMFIIAIVVLSMYSRLDGKARFYPTVPECFLFMALYFMCLINKQPYAVIYVLIAEVIWAVLCIIYYNSRQTMGTLVIFKKMDFVPYKAISRNNNLLLGFSIVTSLIFISLCIILDYGKEIGAALSRGFKAFLTWIFSFFNYEPTVDYEVPESEPLGGGFGKFIPQAEEDSHIWYIIWQTLFYMVATVVTIFLIILVIKGIKEFYHLFNASRIGIRDRLSRDKVEYLNPLGSSQDAWGQKKKRLTLRERLTPAGRIRRMFVKYIEGGLSKKHETARTCDTPFEMEQRVSQGRERAFKLYEKARYSSEPVSSQDVSAMKDLIKY